MSDQQALDALAIGRAVFEIQKPMSAIRVAAKALGIAPCMVLNGVTYYRRADVDAIAEHLFSRTRTTKPEGTNL